DLRRPELLQRRPVAPAQERAVHGPGEKRRHLEPRNAVARRIGRRRRAGRDLERENLQDEGTEGVVGRIDEGATDPQHGRRTSPPHTTASAAEAAPRRSPGGAAGGPPAPPRPGTPKARAPRRH